MGRDGDEKPEKFQARKVGKVIIADTTNPARSARGLPAHRTASCPSDVLLRAFVCASVSLSRGVAQHHEALALRVRGCTAVL